MARSGNELLQGQIGMMTMQLCQLQSQLEGLSEGIESSFGLLYECIKSEQVPPDAVEKMLQDPMFKMYYAKRQPA